MANKVTIFGAGSVVFFARLGQGSMSDQALNGRHVCFMDINEEVLDVIYALGRRYAEDLGADMTFEKDCGSGSRVKRRRFCNQHGNCDAQ